LKIEDAFVLYSRSGKIDGIYGDWIKSDLYQDYGGMSLNLSRFQNALNSGMTREEAAFKTITGEWARSKGFTKPRFVEEVYKPSDRVEIIFEK
jgi:hypothetical protein